MADLSQVSLKNPLGPNSNVESTLLGVELVCCLQHSITIVRCKIPLGVNSFGLDIRRKD